MVPAMNEAWLLLGAMLIPPPLFVVGVLLTRKERHAARLEHNRLTRRVRRRLRTTMRTIDGLRNPPGDPT